MAQVCGAASGLLAFSAMIVCGMCAGNRAETIILRALGGLFGGYCLGTLVGWIGTTVLRDGVRVAADEESTDEAASEAPPTSAGTPGRGQAA